MYRVHYFDTSEAAHDACLDDGPCIEEGDVLAILSEGVIGLASTDPIAVTLDPGALRIVRPMAMDVLLAELVHGASQIRRAGATAHQHPLPLQPQFHALVAPALPYPYPQTVVALSFDDIMLTIDAIHHRITALERRLGTLESDSAHAFFLQRSIDHLSAARKRLMRHPRPPR
jgi:hypothetical protein